MRKIQQLLIMSLFIISASTFGCVDHWLEELKPHVAQELGSDGSHDLSHMERVSSLARRFAHDCGANELVAATAGLLHDLVILPKNHPEREKASEMAALRAEAILQELGYPEELIPQVSHAVAAHSYSAGIEPRTLEAMCVQDADRMEAIGAMGWLRCFYVSGHMGSKMLDSLDPSAAGRELNDRVYALDHFVLKLQVLPTTMKTKPGQALAASLANFLADYRLQLIDLFETQPFDCYWDDLYLCALLAHRHGARSLALFHEQDPFADFGRDLDTQYLVDLFLAHAEESPFARRLLAQLRFELSGYQAK